MKIAWLVVLVIITALLEASFLGALRPFGIIPNLALIVVLYVATDLQASEALAVALGTGLLLDLASSVDFGLRTAYLGFFALAVIIIRRTGADFSRISMLLAVVISAGVLWNITVLLGPILAHDAVRWASVIRIIVVETLVNCGLLLLLHIPLRWLMAAIEGRQPVVSIRGS
jgi:rod shape-determining protein MreD